MKLLAEVLLTLAAEIPTTLPGVHLTRILCPSYERGRSKDNVHATEQLLPNQWPEAKSHPGKPILVQPGLR